MISEYEQLYLGTAHTDSRTSTVYFSYNADHLKTFLADKVEKDGRLNTVTVNIAGGATVAFQVK